jgi:hypothetical protein
MGGIPSSVIDIERTVIAHRFSLRSTAVQTGFDTAKLVWFVHARRSPARQHARISIVKAATGAGASRPPMPSIGLAAVPPPFAAPPVSRGRRAR